MGAHLTPNRTRALLAMLGSPSEPEAINALLAARRLGLAFNDVAAALPAEPVAAPIYRPRPRPTWWFTPKQEGEHRHTARRCLDADRGRLRPRDREFLVQVAARPSRLTIRQSDWLADLALKTGIA